MAKKQKPPKGKAQKPKVLLGPGVAEMLGPIGGITITIERVLQWRQRNAPAPQTPIYQHTPADDQPASDDQPANSPPILRDRGWGQDRVSESDRLGTYLGLGLVSITTTGIVGDPTTVWGEEPQG